MVACGAGRFAEGVGFRIGGEYSDGTYGGGIFHSTDNGTIWSWAGTGLPNYYVTALTASDRHLFAGTGGGGVFLSTNNGVSWEGTNNPEGAYVRSLAVCDKNLLVGTFGSGIFRSTDNGTSWVTANTVFVNLR